MGIIRVFKAYMLKYLMGFFVVFATNIVMLHVAEDSIESYIIKRVKNQVEAGVQRIEEARGKMNLISQMMQRNNGFVKLMHSGATFQKDLIIDLQNSNKLIKEVGYVSDYTPYMFTLFQNNDLFLSSSQCTTTFADYYDTFLTVDIPGVNVMDSNGFRSLLLNNKKEGTYFLKTDLIRYMDDGKEVQLEDALLYLADENVLVPSRKYVFCFLVSKEYLVNSILGEEFEEQDCFLSIKDEKMQAELLRYGDIPEQPEGKDTKTWERQNDYHEIECTSNQLKWQVTAGVSSAYIERQMSTVENLLMIYLYAGFGVSVLLALYFSLARWYGFRKVLGSFPLEDLEEVKAKRFDEYQFISENVAKLDDKRKLYKLQLDELKRQNQAIILENLITRGEGAEQEWHVVPEFYCVVVVRFKQKDGEGSEAITVNMVELLKKRLLVMAHVHSGIADELFLIECLPNQNTDRKEILCVFEAVTAEICEKYNCILHIGISSVGTGISNVNKCYEQAKRIVQSQYIYENKSVVRVYELTENTQYENPVTVEFMSRLYTMLISGQYENVEKELRQVEKWYNRTPYLYEMHKEQVFYAIRNVFYTVVLYLNSEDGESVLLPNYDHTMKCSDTMWEFQRCAKYICEYIHRMKKSKNETLRETIQQYIEKHYQDPGLSAFIVSQNVGIAEKYLYQFWKEQTGETFAVYLLHIRIDKAKEYLEQTDYNNEEIAAMTGFASTNTFYRNFQKVVGITPKKYRENIMLKRNE